MRHTLNSTRIYIGLLIAAPLLVGCGVEVKKPLGRDQIHELRRQVPVLHLTEDGNEVIAPGTQEEAVIDPDSGKIAWRAWKCNNPDCPGEGKGRSTLLVYLAEPHHGGEGWQNHIS